MVRIGIGMILLGTTMWVVLSLGAYDSHVTNFRYLNWKFGRAPQDYRWCLHLMMVDSDLLEKMRGKPLSQIRQWLPETGPARPGSWEKEWLSYMPSKPNITYEQIGESNLAIELEKGKVNYIFRMKG